MIVRFALLIALSATYGHAGVITEEQHPNRGLIPEALKGATEVFLGKIVGAGFKTYTTPKPEDPEDALYRDEEVVELFYVKGERIAMNSPLEALLAPFDSTVTSQIVLLQPYTLIGVGSDGSHWLISVRRQDPHTTIVPLRAVGDESPLDQVYWPYLESGYYQSDSPALQKLLRSRETSGTKEPNQAVQ